MTSQKTTGTRTVEGDGLGEAEVLGDGAGEALGDGVGDSVGSALGETLGETLGLTLGDGDGRFNGLGPGLGTSPGCCSLGVAVGVALIEALGVGDAPVGGAAASSSGIPAATRASFELFWKAMLVVS